MQWSRSEREKMKFPFGCAQGAVFVFLCPLSVMQWSRSEREKGNYTSAVLRVPCLIFSAR
jgi:hypothetical protein